MRPIISIVIAAIILLAVDSVFIVSEGQTAILLQFGRITEAGFKPGLHFKLPLVQQALRFDRRLQTLDAAAERYLTSEKKDVNVDFVVKWRISDSSKFYTAVAGDQERAQQRLAPIVKDGMRTAINSRTLKEVVSSARSDLTDSLVQTANKAAMNLGIDIVDVRIKRVDLPEESSVLRSVYERMRSERKQVADALRAEGNEAAERIRSDADRQVQVIKAEAYREAQTGRGEGDAEAARIYASSYGKDAEFYAFYRSLEAYREAFTPANGVLVLDPKSEFLHYLQDSK
ncbi:MAG: protease modulator HflC [Xanthomonadales bacterium]|nr:protease modulator HflC [Xanthomonadales bacterium]MBL0223538.1 protease modulator HflC [Xanthomonadales bacterium]